MKPSAILAAVCILGSALVAAASPTSAPADTLRLMSFNVRNGIGIDNRSDIGRTAEAIRRASPDIVALQELDSVTRRSHGRYILGELADLTGLRPLFAGAIDYEGGRYGIGILSRRAPLRSYALPLPGREEARALLVAEFDDLVFACTHLSLTEPDRLASVAVIDSMARALDRPFFIAGDFNSEPADTVMRRIADRFVIVTDTLRRTFPADHPQVTIDYIAVGRDRSAPIRLLGADVPFEPAASDHRPVISDILLPRRASAASHP